MTLAEAALAFADYTLVQREQSKSKAQKAWRAIIPCDKKAIALIDGADLLGRWFDLIFADSAAVTVSNSQ